MAENTPDSLATSQDPRSKRPTKRRALSPTSKQAESVEALFAQPDREIAIPDGTVSKTKTLAPPPEIVQNVQGSSAGAGSGEFHVYKASRRREYERLRMMDEETQKEKDEANFSQQQEERKQKDDEKTRKNREKREKAKKRKAKGKDGTPSADSGAEAGPKKTFGKGPRKITQTQVEDDTGEEGTNGNGANQDETGITILDDD